MRTTNQFPKRTDFYAALVRALNDLYDERTFRFRYYGASTAQEMTTTPDGYVEPGVWKIDRISRGGARRVETARILFESLPPSSDALRVQLEEITDFLDAIASRFVRNPEIVPGAFCSEVRAFSDAAPLYDPSSAYEKTPILYAGIEATFWWIV